MNLEYIENKHSNDKGLFIGEEITFICESFQNGIKLETALQAINNLFKSLHCN